MRNSVYGSGPSADQKQRNVYVIPDNFFRCSRIRMRVSACDHQLGHKRERKKARAAKVIQEFRARLAVKKCSSPKAKSRKWMSLTLVRNNQSPNSQRHSGIWIIQQPAILDGRWKQPYHGFACKLLLKTKVIVAIWLLCLMVEAARLRCGFYDSDFGVSFVLERHSRRTQNLREKDVSLLGKIVGVCTYACL